MSLSDKPKRATRNKGIRDIATPPPKQKHAKKTTPLQKDNDGDSLTTSSNFFQNPEDNPQPPELQSSQKLDKSFYNQDTITFSKALLGKVLCRRLPGTGEVLKGTIVETEAYPGEGRSPTGKRSLPMCIGPGTAFVYITYGVYHCFNISAQDTGGACLLRAAEVHQNYEIMHTFRQSKRKPIVQTTPEENDKPVASFKKRLKIHELANGPSKLCMSFDITKAAFNKADMTVSDDLWLEESTDPKFFLKQFEVKISRRVGIDTSPPESRNKMYRFYIDDNLSVSKAKFKDDDDDK